MTKKNVIKLQTYKEEVRDENGQISQTKESEFTEIKVPSEPNYIKLYIQDIAFLNDIPKKYIKLLFALLRRTSYANEEDGLCIVLAPRIKKHIIKEIGWEKMSSLNNALSDLAKGKILKRLESNVYQFNAFFFGKGDWKKIHSIRLTMDYNEIKGKTFSTYLTYKEPDLGIKPKQDEDGNIIGQQMPSIEDFIKKEAVGV